MAVAPRHMSVRRQVAELRKTMRAADATPAQIAAAIGARLRVNPRVAWRLTHGLTQEQVADRYNTTWSPNPPKTGKHISYWERWDGPGSRASTSARAPSHLDLTRLATLYGCTVDDLLSEHQQPKTTIPKPPKAPAATGYAEPDRPAASDPEEEGDATNRREMLTSMTAAGIALAGLPPPLLLDSPRRINPEHAAEVRRLTQMYRAWIYEHGASGQLQGGVARLLDHVTHLSGQASDARTRQDLLDALADVAELAAYVCRDLGLQQYAEQHYLIAFQAAQAAGNQALAGHTVVRMAGHQLEVVQPGHVLDYLDAARRIGRMKGFTHGELSNQHAIQAWAHAQSGRAQSVHQAVGLAEEHSAQADDRGGPDWRVRHVAEAELYSLTGAGYAALAQHHPTHAPEAIRRLQLALDLRGFGGARNATLDKISLAEAHIINRDLPEAVTAARSAVESAGTSSSRRVRARLTELRHQLQPHTRTPDVAELIHRMDTISEARTHAR